jgi:hypothetical protein
MHSTSNLNDGYLGSGKRLRRSIEKYGVSSFKIEILEFLPDRESLAKRESELVDEILLKDINCINLKPGGKGGLCSAKHAYDFHAAGGRKVRQMLSIRHAERLKTDKEYREKFISKLIGNKNWLGKKHTDETKKKIGQANAILQKGEKNSQYGSKWITDGKENKKIKNDAEIPDGWKPGRVIKLMI